MLIGLRLFSLYSGTVLDDKGNGLRVLRKVCFEMQV